MSSDLTAAYKLLVQDLIYSVEFCNTTSVFLVMLVALALLYTDTPGSEDAEGTHANGMQGS